MEIRKGAVARKWCTDPFLYKKLQLNFISIHTPARGVTLQERVKHRQHIYISIHTPTRGVTAKLLNLSETLHSDLSDSNKTAT